MTRGVTFRPLSQTSSPSTRIPHSPGAPSRHRIRLGIPGKPLLSIGGNASSISLSGARLLAAGSLLMTISKLKTPSGLYRFHVYYTTRHLLVELKVAPTTDWKQKLDNGCQGLGSWSTYMEPSGAYRHAHYSDGPFFHPMDAIRHRRDISGAWTMFILDKSEGFTQAGVERLNDSIRTYVWAILGAQAQTRSNILKAGTGFDAQKQFLANVEDAIASPIDIPSSIARYQKTVHQPLWTVFRIGLYLSPSDMALHPGNVQGYNNEIVITGSEAAIGHNPGINESEQIGKTAGDKSVKGKIAASARTEHKGPPSGKPAADPAGHADPVADPQGQEQHASGHAAATSHEEEKTALIAAGVVGLVALWLGSH